MSDQNVIQRAGANQLRNPDLVEEITAAWLTQALSGRFPGLIVTAARQVDRIAGASSKVWFEVETNRADFPKTLICKAGFEEHSPAMQYMHANEVRAYADFVPTIETHTCDCYFAHVDDRGRSMVILEDLRPRAPVWLSLQRPIGFERASRFLDGLAKIHARWWGDDKAFAPGGVLDWAVGANEGGMRRYLDMMADPAVAASYFNAPRGAAMPMMLHDADRIIRAHAAMCAYNATLPQTLNHGDMHLGNLYTEADGTPGYLDWQPRRGPWVLDVSYFMIAGLDLVDRRRWQGALLQHYLTRLAAYGVAPPAFEDAWLTFRKNVIYGFLVWLLNGSHFQTESVNTAAATRFAMAMVDLDGFGVLGV